MGLIHNELRRGPLGRAWKNALGISAQAEGGLERYGETLTPIADLWGRPEWAFLRSEQLAAGNATANAIAGELAYAALLNPAGSGALVTVESVRVFSGAAMIVLLHILTDAEIIAAGLVAQTTGSRDTRWGLAGIRRMAVGTHSATLGQLVDQVSAIGTDFRAFANLPIILSPGFNLVAIGQTVNTAMTTVWGWRDRPSVFRTELV
jgi:hypothetical protein